MNNPNIRVGYDLEDLRAAAQLLGLTPKDHRALQLTVIHTERGFFDPVVKPAQFAELVACVVYNASPVTVELDLDEAPGYSSLCLFDNYTKRILARIVGQPCTADSMIKLYLKAAVTIWRDRQIQGNEDEQI